MITGNVRKLERLRNEGDKRKHEKEKEEEEKL